MHDVIIVGAGPAGLAAATYALRKHLDVLVVSPNLGGKSVMSVDIPGTQAHQVIRAGQLIRDFRQALEYLDYAYTLGTAVEIIAEKDMFRVKTEAAQDGEEAVHRARALIVATGTRIQRLGVPGEEEFLGKSLGYSSISYSHLLLDKRVFLLGNSQRTVEAAVELASQAREVFLLLERSGKYYDVYRSQLSAFKNIHVLEDRTVQEFQGGTHAERALLLDASGKTETVNADAFFIQRQPAPNSEFVSHLVDRDAEDRIVVDTRNRTSAPGVFAAGDVTNIGFEQIVIAIGEGAKAALGAYEYVVSR